MNDVTNTVHGGADVPYSELQGLTGLAWEAAALAAVHDGIADGGAWMGRPGHRDTAATLRRAAKELAKAGKPVGHFLESTPGEWGQVSPIYIGDADVVPLYAAPPSAERAKPVEHKDFKRFWDNYVAAHTSPFDVKHAVQIAWIDGHESAALAHPRPTGAGIGTHAVIAEITEAVKADRYVSDTDLASGVFGPAMLAFARKVASEYLSRPTAPTVEQAGEVDAYYLQDSRSYTGNCPMWWAKGEAGYTTNLDQAHRYTFAQAMKKHRCRETDVPWACAEIDALRRPTVDVQHMRSVKDQVAKLLAAPAPAKAGEA